MADDRRIIVTTKVFGKEGNTLEEGDVKYIFDSNISESNLGAKFVTDVSAEQDVPSEDVWYAESLTIAGLVQLRSTGQDDVLKCCYIKNKGSGLMTISLTGATEEVWGDNYYQWELSPRGWSPLKIMVLGSGESIFFRGNDEIKCDTVYVDGTTEIEYLIAK